MKLWHIILFYRHGIWSQKTWVKNNKSCSAFSDKILNLSESFPRLQFVDAWVLDIVHPRVSTQVHVHTTNTHPKKLVRGLWEGHPAPLILWRKNFSPTPNLGIPMFAAPGGSLQKEGKERKNSSGSHAGSQTVNQDGAALTPLRHEKVPNMLEHKIPEGRDALSHSCGLSGRLGTRYIKCSEWVTLNS